MAIHVKSPVRLRSRKLSNESSSLYLDIYINGSRTYEYLHMYLVPERSKADRAQNKETMRLADTIRAQRELDIQTGRYKLGGGARARAMLLLDWADACIEQLRSENMSERTIKTWRGMKAHVSRCFGGSSIALADIDEHQCARFRDYLTSAELLHHGGYLAQNTQAALYAKFRAMLNRAVDNGLMDYNPASRIKGLSEISTERTYLTFDELSRLINTDFAQTELGRAFVFSCLTGLRWSDIVQLRYEMIQLDGGRARIIYRQQKTRKQEYLDINRQAFDILGWDAAKTGLIFGNISYNYSGDKLTRWAYEAGIRKHVTFHAGRHTFAVMMLEYGADIYTISKLLGHSNIRTTEIYAKMLDKRKQDAVDLIPDIFSEKKS